MVIAGAVLQVEGGVVSYDWTVDYSWGAPDCVEKLILAVNGQYPSPTIRAVEGDTVVVKITNHIPTEAVVFHWHGMHQVLNSHWQYGNMSRLTSCSSPCTSHMFKNIFCCTPHRAPQ